MRIAIIGAGNVRGGLDVVVLAVPHGAVPGIVAELGGRRDVVDAFEPCSAPRRSPRSCEHEAR